MADGAGSRARFDGSAEDLANALQTTVLPRGRSFLVYDHTQNTSKAKTSKDDIGNAHEVLKALKVACPKLAFKRSQVRQALDILYKQNMHEPKWRLAPADLPQWLTMMTNRIMNLAHAVRQGEQKHPTAAWVRCLPWNQAGPASSSCEPPSRTEWIYGYDMEMKQAWRLPGNHPQGAGRKSTKKEYSIQVREQDKKLVASWSDNSKWAISGISIDRWKGPQKVVANPPYWQGEHEVSHDRLVVRHRNDRCVEGLTALYEQGHQILQVNNRDFDSKVAAGSFMTGIAQAYAKGDLQREQLKNEVKCRMANLGIVAKKRRVQVCCKRICWGGFDRCPSRLPDMLWWKPKHAITCLRTSFALFYTASLPDAQLQNMCLGCLVELLNIKSVGNHRCVCMPFSCSRQLTFSCSDRTSKHKRAGYRA